MKGKFLAVIVASGIVAANAQTSKPSAAKPYGSNVQSSVPARTYNYSRPAWQLPVGTPVKIR